MIIYSVQEGDTVESIAEQFNVSVSRLLTDNNLPPRNLLNIGQAIMIAPPSQTYLVQEGDTLESISKAYGISLINLLRNNPELSELDTLPPGYELILSYDVDKPIEVGGYSSAFITDTVLHKTLPFLTYLFILNYRVDGNGSISEVEDEWIINTAKEYGVAPIMFLSAMTSTGKGSYAITHAIITNPEVQDKLIENILFTLKKNGFLGLDLAFYSILKEDLELYADFVSKVRLRLNQEGYEVFVTITPHTMGYTPNQSINNPYYEKLGAAADKVILISYLWQQESLSQVGETTADYLKLLLDYVVTQITPDKLFIGLARIAYDWELPYVEGETQGASLTDSGAINLASQLGIPIEFDQATQTPFFYYNSSGVNHFVWFRDARSILSIINLVDEYGLRGVAVWNIMYYYPPTWLPLNSTHVITRYEDTKEVS